ncbi:UDP-N-acetylmuramoyl-tripeptide--D-alanyl-D-alanine ligase [Lipingzhangella sp. LS1_29]|uniref:UDP-N-acetylmuramoyl-tripeptide--D-alanyl-D-alanine ligase n=1 Tax=Lipingzhangella rawalii TaxID=2055835 RepID=A0ABU2H335_9ACTN|nr:UDP-N-acetylmuramoyl-tripeptide--D-alanyl-D-alanine ligase [Lipingzhangella rawalii]MDS1269402.1 UDP-N-acetylmuramoyl-tripeptide--D-alanyl-D-alanine ligase [Lipingzhangella rawalii]
MIALTLDRIAEVTRAHSDAAVHETMVTGPVVVDSRAVTPGALFVALRGEKVDGHDFAGAARSAGAAAVLGSRPMAGVESERQLVVDGGDTEVVAALGRLARHVVAALPHADVIGVTGSAGKTTTKDLLAQVLEPRGSTVAAAGSFNNEIGHPLTVLRATEDTRFIVAELAARGRGHIAHLATVAPPRIGVVLNVGTAHLGEFGSREAIAVAKGELVEALPRAENGGVAILNADDDAVLAMAGRTAARVITVGQHAEAMVRASSVRLDPLGRARFTLHLGADHAPAQLGLSGEHQVANALAVAGVLTALDPDLGAAECASALGQALPMSPSRMDVRTLADGTTVIDDAYNANPDSVAAALSTLRTIAGSDRRAIAVLGHMAELGAEHDSEHHKVGRVVAETGVDELIVVGPEAAPIAEGARASGMSAVRQVADATEATAELDKQRGAADRPLREAILVKGSRVAGLEQVAERLYTQGGVQ